MATDYNGELNFIVEHVGLPRIEDFCFMATQEPNVYAGLSVVVGGLMHARPAFFAKVMGELLFWVGEDKMLFGSDYGIWEPKWQIEGLLDWEMPDHFAYSDFPRLDESGKRKILGLNAAKLYGVEVPAELPERRGHARRSGRRPAGRMTQRSRVLEALGTVYDPELDEPITDLGFVGSVVVAGGAVAVRLRLPTPQCAPNFAFLMAADASRAIWRVDGVESVDVTLEDHYTGDEINATVNAGRSFADAFPGETRGELDALRALFQRKALLARQSRLLEVPAARLGDLHGPDADRVRELRRALGIDASDDAAPYVTGDGVPVSADDQRFRRMASLTALSLETNGGMCRDLLRVRYGEEVAA